MGISSTGQTTVRCSRCGKSWPPTTKTCPDDGARLYVVQTSAAVSHGSSLDGGTEIDAPFKGSLTDFVSVDSPRARSAPIAPPSVSGSSVPVHSSLDAATEIASPYSGSLTDAFPRNTGTAIDAPFSGSLTDLVPGPRSSAITSPKVPAALGSSVPITGVHQAQTLGSNAPESSRAHGPHDPFAADLARGTRVGEYQIEGKIGEGAMGAVYRAIHPAIGKHVAVKIMNPRLCGDAGAIERFTREARSVAAIRHPGIVDVFGFGTLDDGRAYLIMEWLDGTSLGTRITHGRLGYDDALDVLHQIARALAAAHDKGITHRDLKPDNIFLQHVSDDKPVVKILDFGLAKLASDESRIAMTQTGQLLGTPIYMSPEQCKGKGVDHRTDIYALGCIGYELVCGRVPFLADNLAELMAAHLGEQPPPPRSIWPQIPPQLDAIFFAMLAKDAAQRPTLKQVRQTLGALRSPAAMTAVPGHVQTPASGVPSPVPQYVTPATGYSGPAPSRWAPVPTQLVPPIGATSTPSSRRALVLAVAAILAIGIGIGVIVTARSTGTSPSVAADHGATSSEAPRRSLPPATTTPPTVDTGELTTGSATATAMGSTKIPTTEPPNVVSDTTLAKATSRTSSATGKKATNEKPRTTSTDKPQIMSTTPAAATGTPRTATSPSQSNEGTLTLDSNPSAEVLIDGERKGLRTPVIGLKLPPGPHRITLINATYSIKESFVVEIRDGQAERLVKDFSDRIAVKKIQDQPKADPNRSTLNPFKKKDATP